LSGGVTLSLLSFWLGIFLLVVPAEAGIQLFDVIVAL
jgi:hypothetical protein